MVEKEMIRYYVCVCGGGGVRACVRACFRHVHEAMHEVISEGIRSMHGTGLRWSASTCQIN